jgi:chaperonin GroES
MAKYIPLYDHVTIQPDAAEKQSKGGIFIPDAAQEKPRKGVVVNVGYGRPLMQGGYEALRLKPGDKVLFNRYGQGTSEFETEDGSKLYIMREGDILATIVE